MESVNICLYILRKIAHFMNGRFHVQDINTRMGLDFFYNFFLSFSNYFHRAMLLYLFHQKIVEITQMLVEEKKNKQAFAQKKTPFQFKTIQGCTIIFIIFRVTVPVRKNTLYTIQSDTSFSRSPVYALYDRIYIIKYERVGKKKKGGKERRRKRANRPCNWYSQTAAVLIII